MTRPVKEDTVAETATSATRRMRKMSVLIKGMGMPESCEDCSAQIIDPTGGASGCAVNHSIILRKRGERRPTECPLVEVPKHGRLIDADVLMDKIGITKDCTDCKRSGIFGCREDLAFVYACGCIDDAPTIIEAEE